MESQDGAVAKMKEIQKTRLRDIVKSIRIFYDPYPLAASTVIDEDRELLQRYEEFNCGEDGSPTSPWIVRLEMNDMQMASRNILDMVQVQSKISANPALKIVECRYSDPMAKNLVMRLMFDPAVVKNPIQLRFLEDKLLDTPLTGVPGIGRVFQRRVKNEMVYDAQVGGYKPLEQYVLDVEGTNLYDLMVFPGVDGTRTFSNDIHEINQVFGIEAARLAIYEEINEVFASEKVNYHHLAVLVDTMTFSGRIVPVNRFGMSKNETGVLAKSSFEETSKIMFNAAIWAEKDSMKGVSANIMFGQKPPCGTGFVDILVDEARLPEGEEEAPEDDTLEKVNQRLENVAPTDCRLEDILMEW
jgi:DNA-directed RNA polymerase II subunit RPB1